LEAEETATATDADGSAEPAGADETPTDGPAGEDTAASGSEPAPETLEQPAQDTDVVGSATAPGADDEVADAWGPDLAPSDRPRAEETPAEGAAAPASAAETPADRSEERRGGRGGGSTC